MKRVFASELKRAMNSGIIVAVIGIAFCICFDSWNDLINAVQNRNPAFCVYYFWRNVPTLYSAGFCDISICCQLLRRKKQPSGGVYRFQRRREVV